MFRFLSQFMTWIMLFSCAYADTQEIQQAIKVSADSSLVNYKLGLTTYEGNVVIDQGSTHLAADKITTKNNNKHKIKEAIAYGIKKQVEYSSIPKPGDNLLHASANKIKFYPETYTVVLEGNVLVTQGKNSFHGERIIYNTKTQEVSVPATAGGRATLIIEQPDQLKL